MSDDNQTPDATPVEERPMREERKFLICNSTRGRANRTLRAQQAKHHPLRQHLGGGKYRIIRGRPITLTESEVMTHIKEIREKVLSGALEIRTQDGRLVDVETGEPMTDLQKSMPLPNPPMDSIANDKQNVGQRMPQFAGGDTEGDTSDVPALVAGAPVTETEETTPAADPPAAPPTDDKPADAAPPVTETASETTSTETTELPDLVGGGVTEAVTAEVPAVTEPVKEEKKSKKERNK